MRRRGSGWGDFVAVSMLLGSGACGAQTVPRPLLPAGVAYDAAGNLFVADTRANQVFEVMLSGATTVVAGTGAQGFGGDGGTAAAALLSGPTSVAVAADGTVYIADAGNERIRAVAGGQIQTVAGSGAKGFSGDGGNALLAMLNTPLALAVDAGGGLLIADSGNHRLRRLSAGVLTTVAGTGVQGFAGDGLAATAAQMDTPAGVAVAGDGRVFVADSHNHRIRVIGTDGKIATFAGSGARGFGGDGGAAIAATLFLPRGVVVTPTGDVIFADSDNQRLRMVNTQGVISTVAGNGVQGRSAEGAVARNASLDSPRGIALSGFGAPVFADAHNSTVREIATDADMYALLGGTSHVVVVTLATPAALTYGQGAASVSVMGAAPVAQGNVALLDGGVPVSLGTLAGAAVALPADTLTAGQHTLTAAFAGDGVHSAATSPAVTVDVAPLAVTATAQPTTMTYGSFTPAIAGTLTGVLARDATLVTANFTSTAPNLSPVGTYPIAASLSGVASANYTLTAGSSAGSLTIVPAAAAIAVSGPQTSYVGFSVTLTAVVGSSTRGAPTGVVNFVENGVVVGTGTVNGGTATGVYLNPSAGTHAIAAVYGGDHNFLAETSATTAITVSALPDFSLAVNGSSTQTVQGGTIASYTLQVGAQPGPFSGSVTMSASGLPPGATVSFSPAAVVPGNSSAAVTMFIQTTVLAMRMVKTDVRWAMVLVFGLAVPWGRRRRRSVGLMVLALVALGGSSVGCGSRSFPTSARATQTSAITVTATSTNLAGAVITHAVSVTLIVQ
ncbi:MAG: Ig-like domain repeat protein [Acidobacteriota bacterium]|nr:Ig-like domain repeat protein [Acidobacteriota bacterium]